LVNKLVIENLKYRPIRTALSVVAIGLEVAMMLTIVGLSEGMLADLQQRARGIGADIIIRPPGSSALSLSSAPLPQKLVDWVEQQPHVEMAVGAMTHPVAGLTTMTGIDLDRFTRMSGGFRYEAGNPPRQPNEILVDTYYARQNKLRVGSIVKFWNRGWRVSGIIEQGKLARLAMPLAVLQDVASSTGKISQIYAKVDDPEEIDGVIADLKSKLVGYPIYSVPEFVSLFAVDKVPGLREFIGVIIGLSVAVGFLVVFLSMYTAVLERTREIGILKALGASPVFVLGILLRETLLLAIFGSALGIGFSYVTRWLIMTLVPASLSQIIVYGWWPIAGAIALAGALVGAAYPGWRAARQDPIEALSYE
jgi:putative ABC transport system permease protein